MNLTVTQLLDLHDGMGPTIKKLCLVPSGQIQCQSQQQPLPTSSLLSPPSSSSSPPQVPVVKPPVVLTTAQEKALANSLILSAIFERVPTSDLLNSVRLVNTFWCEEATRVLLQGKSLRIKPGFTQKIKDKNNCNGRFYGGKNNNNSLNNARRMIMTMVNFQLTDLKDCLEVSRRFPSTSLSFHLGTLGSREAQTFLTRHARMFTDLYIEWGDNSPHVPHDLRGLSYPVWKDFVNFLYLRLSHIESLHVRSLPFSFSLEESNSNSLHNNSNNNNNSNSNNINNDSMNINNMNNDNDSGNFGRKRKKREISLVLPNLKLLTLQQFRYSDEFFVHRILESAPNLERLDLGVKPFTLNCGFQSGSSILSPHETPALYKLLSSLGKMNLIKHHTFNFSEMMSNLEFVKTEPKLESVEFWGKACGSFGECISRLFSSSKDTLKKVKNLPPIDYFVHFQFPDRMKELRELQISDRLLPDLPYQQGHWAAHRMNNGGEGKDWIFPPSLTCRLQTTFPCLNKVVLDLQSKSFEWWRDLKPSIPPAYSNNNNSHYNYSNSTEENDRSDSLVDMDKKEGNGCSSSSSSASSFSTVTDLTLTNEPEPSFASSIQRLAELFPNVDKLKVGNVFNLPSSSEYIWSFFTRLKRLELAIDVGWAFSNGSYRMDYAFTGDNRILSTKRSIVDLKELRTLKLDFFDPFEITRFPCNDNAQPLMSNWAGENAFRFMPNTKVYISLSCVHPPNFDSWKAALEPLRPYAESFIP